MNATRNTGKIKVRHGNSKQLGSCSCCNSMGEVYEIEFGQLHFRACEDCLQTMITLVRDEEKREE